MNVAVIGSADADLIEQLIEGLEVVQIGCHQGFDTAMLARSAVRVLATGQRTDLGHAGFASPAHMWQVIQGFYGTAKHTLMVQGDPAQVIAALLPDQFDVAIIDVNAFPDGVPWNTFPLINHAAHKVIVIPRADGGMQAWPGVLAGMGYVIEQCGRLWVIEPAPAAADDKTKDEG